MKRILTLVHSAFSRRLKFFKMEPGHVFIIGSSVEFCFLIEYMLQL